MPNRAWEHFHESSNHDSWTALCSTTLLRIIILLQKVIHPPPNHPLLMRCCETGVYHFVNCHGLNDRVSNLTSSTLTQCCSDFCDNVALCDGGCCVVMWNQASMCEAAHIIPHSKGNQVPFQICCKCLPGYYNVPLVHWLCHFRSQHFVWGAAIAPCH